MFLTRMDTGSAGLRKRSLKTTIRFVCFSIDSNTSPRGWFLMLMETVCDRVSALRWIQVTRSNTEVNFMIRKNCLLTRIGIFFPNDGGKSYLIITFGGLYRLTD